MKCPQCVKEGKKSMVTYEGAPPTLEYRPVMFDEDGHLIDWNKGEYRYHCTNGHVWKT